MFRSNQRLARVMLAWLMAIAILTMPFATFAQTRISLHDNRYSVADDVRLGRQVAVEAEQQLPILRDEDATYYVSQVGRRLVNAIPPEFQHREFNYYFKIVNARDINAFALPGGPMYVNRGMIEAARSEGEMAGVMAHELSHVALRHGTAQATKGGSLKAQAPAIGGAILGAILGGTIGGAVAQAGQIGSAAYLTKFSREYETEADVLGAQIMARAGYDPHDLANMFRTIEQQGGGSGAPEWLSSHPNPGRRYERINQEAALLRVNGNATQDTAEFRRIQSRLRGQGRAPSMAEIARSGQRYPQNGEGAGTSPSYGGQIGRVQYPSTRYRTYTGGQLFQLRYPDNWRELPDNNSVWLAPEGGYGQAQGINVFTHGANIGITQAQSNDLRQATDAFIRQLAQASGNMRQQTNYQRGTIDNHAALSIVLSNVNEATGQPESITVYTTMLRNGALFYVIAVAPQREYRSFQGAFLNLVNSIRLND